MERDFLIIFLSAYSSDTVQKILRIWLKAGIMKMNCHKETKSLREDKMALADFGMAHGDKVTG